MRGKNNSGRGMNEAYTREASFWCWVISMESQQDLNKGRGRNVPGREEGWANPWTETGEQATVHKEGGIMNAADGHSVECVPYQEQTVSQRDPLKVSLSKNDRQDGR